MKTQQGFTAKLNAAALWCAQNPRHVTVIVTMMTLLVTAVALAAGLNGHGIQVAPGGGGGSGGTG